MKYMHGIRKSGCLFIALVCCVVLPAAGPCESPEIKLHLDFDTSDPVEYRGRIMEISHEKAQLVVAEDTILVVDLKVGAYRLTTAVTDDSGNSVLLESFKRGDNVLVQGFKNEDGIVFASLLQKLESPTLKHQTKSTGRNVKKRKGMRMGN